MIQKDLLDQVTLLFEQKRIHNTRQMKNFIFNQVSKATFGIFLMFFLSTVSMQAQTGNYRCFCDSSHPTGVLGFEISVSGSSTDEVWTVDNVINLYSNVNPNIPLQNGTELLPDPTSPGDFILTGFAMDGQIPFITILNEGGGQLDVNMTTCVIPTGEVVGDIELCVGETVSYEFDVTANRLIDNSVEWRANGSESSQQFGPDGLNFRVSYDTPGNYIIFAEAESSTGCLINDNIRVTVRDASEGIIISGPDYLCSAAASNIEYMATNPQDLFLSWSSTPAGTFTPMTGSGSEVEATFPGAGLYTINIVNDDPNSCTITGVSYNVNVVDVIDTIAILGDTYVCEGGMESYTISNPSDYSNIQWTVTPSSGVTMFPADGMSETVSVTYADEGINYVVNVTGDTNDGCTFNSDLDVVVPGQDVGTLACNNNVNVSLNNTCILELLPEMILEGENENNDAYSLIIVNADTGEELTNPMLNQDQIGQIYNVTVIEECGGNSCWGTLKVEDKSIPSIVPFCADLPVVTTCFDFDNDIENPTGFPDFGIESSSIYRESSDDFLVTGFDACNDVILSFEDEDLTNDICADPHMLIRTWTAVDQNNGAETSCQVNINVTLLDASMIVWPFNYDSGLDADLPGEMDTDRIYPSLDACNFSNQTVFVNSDTLWIADSEGNPSPESTGYPSSNAFTCPNLQIIGYKDQVLPVCGNSSKKILRLWTVWDACNRMDVQHTQIITLMDITAPICTAPDDTQIYTDTHECSANVVVTPPVVTGECDDYTYTVKYRLNSATGSFTDDNVIFDSTLDRFVIQNVEFVNDYIWVQYIVTDACGNVTDDCFTELEILDKEQPIPACDFNNVVALNSDGWAIAGPGTFDDHSWDNCGIYQSVVRKMDNQCDCHEASFDYLYTLGTYNGHTYYLSKDKFDGYKASQYASAIDGYLVNVNDQEENDWLQAEVSKFGNKEYFIGLSGTTDSTLVWSQEDSISYTSWDKFEPNLSNVNDAKGSVYVVSDNNGVWNAERKSEIEAYYVVELEDACSWSQKVNFCCEDVGRETMVALRVIDNHGNHNFCMVNVNVMEFEKPFITCPSDTIIGCDTNFDLNDLVRFGEATATDNCGVKEILETTNNPDLSSCGQGIVQRTFTASDYAGNTRACTQIINLRGANIFDYTDIVWPSERTFENTVCTLEEISTDSTGVPTWDVDEFSCSNITFTHSDLMFFIADGVCQKLIRTWTVVDWCQNNMLWEETQVIKLINTIAPQIDDETCRPITIDSGIHISECEVRVNGVTANNEFVEGACNDNPNWSYVIDLHDDGIIDRSGEGDDASGIYEYGTHRITWTIFDECGNENSCDKLITVLDNLPPTPYCHGTIVIPVNDSINGVEIWASDLNLGSFDNCPINPVFFSFDENVFEPNIALTCDDLNPGSNMGEVLLDLWIWDNMSSSLANKSTCTVTINVQDNQNICDNIGTGNMVSTVSGTVTTEDLEMVDNVEVSIESNNMSNDMMSNEGEFAFNNLSMYNDYQVDAGVYTELPNNNSWRFVESAYTFNDPFVPFPFAENVEIDNLVNSISNANFIGVKIGDVNSSVVSNVQSSNIDSRALEIANIKVNSSVTTKGNKRLQFIADSNLELLGTQFSIEFNAQSTELLAMIPMSMELTNENVAWDRVEDGDFIVSWNSSSVVDIKAGDVLFELLFKGNDTDIKLNNNSTSYNPEIYTLNNGSVLRQQIKFNGDLNNNYTFNVEQNIPNPFKDETDITFTMEKDGPVVISITDQTGRLVYQESNSYKAGTNSIKLHSNAINTTGLLYYTIATESHTVTKKMIVLQ